MNASTHGSVVILFDEHASDPRHQEEDSERERPDRLMSRQPSKVKVRVVLRQESVRSRVLVEVEDGQDAIGDIAWYRLDFSRSDDPAKNLMDARAAYEVIEGIVGTLYARSRDLEQKLSMSEGKVKQLEHRISAAQILKPKPAPPAIDPLATVKAKFMSLLLLASNEAVGNEERHTAIKTAMDMAAKYDFLKLK